MVGSVALSHGARGREADVLCVPEGPGWTDDSCAYLNFKEKKCLITYSKHSN